REQNQRPGFCPAGPFKPPTHGLWLGHRRGNECMCSHVPLTPTSTYCVGKQFSVTFLRTRQIETQVPLSSRNASTSRSSPGPTIPRLSGHWSSKTSRVVSCGAE